MQPTIPYQVVIVTDEGSVRKERRLVDGGGSHDVAASILIAQQLAGLHESTSFVDLFDLASTQSARMGRQVAFVDESLTIIVTRLYRAPSTKGAAS